MDVTQFLNLPNTGCSPSNSQRKSLNSWVSCKHSKSYFFDKNIADLDYIPFKRVRSRKKYPIKVSSLEDGSVFCSSRLVNPHFPCLVCHRSRKMRHVFPFASADDSIMINGSPQENTSSDIEELQLKLDQSLQSEDYISALVQSLHDAARVFELAIRGEMCVSNLSWFSITWLGVDQNAWLKALSYQASVCSLLLAACEISSRRDRRDKGINVFVQKSLSRLYATLESLIKDALSGKQPDLYEWFRSEQVPMMVSTFVNTFEKDQRFADITGIINKGMSSSEVDASERSLPIFALTCIAAITELGPKKVSCIEFYSLLPDISGGLMEMLVELIPIRKAYHSIKQIGLQREFLVHFGPRAAACGVKYQATEEVLFWVSLVQKQLNRAIDRERIWTKLTSERIEVSDKDLAIFGFFIALGRKTQWFLCANNFESVPEPIEELIRYLIGGGVLYYPQLSSINTYQLYVEVVCEELDWLPFYPGVENLKHSHSHRSIKGPPREAAIALALHVCSHWIRSFIKYSKWLENPSNVKAARFLSKGNNILKRSMKELGLPKKLLIENSATNRVDKAGSRSYVSSTKDLDSFDKAPENVDEALLRLEEVLHEHVSSSHSGKDQLEATCSDLEKIRKLIIEAEFLLASFKAKKDSLQLENTLVPEAEEIQRFEHLRNDLKELESQVKKRDKISKNEEETPVVRVQEKVNIITQSINRFKESSLDVVQGTQLLAIDVAAATGLLIRVLTGDKLTKKEKQTLRRTLTDLASVVPIGFLMLLPVTAVGHAAILAAIQRYVPSLIPSTYSPERLDLLRKLKKVKEMVPATPADEP